ncbi:MAG TPA: 2-dehydropantoate 2-reductase N-terminal domain-containing protein [Polyangium sp.]|nr:2-dehydropantoate 2-reductase N-terminal domain-containing protein [Polyangium sp.]
MHVIVLGAGALGRVYGARLAATGVAVSFLVRPSRVDENYSFVVEQVNGDKRRDVMEKPRRITEIPKDATIVLLTVRFDQIDRIRQDTNDELAKLLRAGPAIPIIVMAPILQPQLEALRGVVGQRIVSAMPGAAGYVDDVDDRGVVRYWATGIAPTLFDDAASGDGATLVRDILEVLARRLTNDGMPTRFDKDVAGLNAASTTAFFPLIAAIDAGHGVDGVLSDKALFETALSAAKECEALAKKIGKVAPWTQLLTRFVGPYTIKPGVAMARRMVPETVRFVEKHFGRKLHAQNLAMGETIRDIGREHGLDMPQLDQLLRILRGS